MAKQWTYTNAAVCTVSDMICTACRKPIERGQYRYRETDDAYLPQHRACSTSDPAWAKIPHTTGLREENRNG